MTRTRINRKHVQAGQGETKRSGQQAGTLQAEKSEHARHTEGTPMSGDTYRCARMRHGVGNHGRLRLRRCRPCAARVLRRRDESGLANSGV